MVASGGGWVANRFSRKQNREAQALERIASAVEISHPSPKPKRDPYQWRKGGMDNTILTPCLHVWKQGNEDDPAYIVCGKDNILPCKIYQNPNESNSPDAPDSYCEANAYTRLCDNGFGVSRWVKPENCLNWFTRTQL